MTSLPGKTPKKARPRDRPRHLRRLPGLRDLLQGVEHRRLFRAAQPITTPMARTPRAPSSTASTATRWPDRRTGRTVHFPRSCLHCEEPLRHRLPDRRQSYKRAEDGIVLVNEDTCIGCKLCAWACPYGAREYDHDDGVMKKCTLCVDRIYNENLPEEDRVPACVRACPAGARAFRRPGRSRQCRVSELWPIVAVSIFWKNSATSRSTSTCRLAPRPRLPARRAPPRLKRSPPRATGWSGSSRGSTNG
jgi:Fe-S-cluster-containing dehydrogenase component